MSLRASLVAAAPAFIGLCLCLSLQPSCARQSPDTIPAAPDLQALQGYWEDSRGSEPVKMTITGDSLYFYERPDFQYDTTFTLPPDTDPPEIHATILDTPRSTDSAGELVVAIYKLEKDTLQISVVDKVEGQQPSFDEAISQYLFQRAQPAE